MAYEKNTDKNTART